MSATGFLPAGGDYTRKLAIIVPYRDRRAHLAQFVPHITEHFKSCPAAQRPCYSIHVIEQLGTDRLNRGKLRNCGFALTQDTADYFVFHDVDYLPVVADYSYVDRPTRLIWHGLLGRETYEEFFGAVTAFNRDDFRLVNGYSNDYWGWGFEDVDLRLRCQAAGLAIGWRDGTFRPLPHKHSGYLADGQPTAEALAMQQTLQKKLPNFLRTYRHEGLISLRMTVQAVQVIPDGSGVDRVFLHSVRI